MAKPVVRAFPNRKISETFLEFAAPLLRDLPDDNLEQYVGQALQVAFMAWNAVIFSDGLNDRWYLDEVRRLTANTPEATLLIEQMIARKCALFGNDDRLIGTWELTRTEDGFNLRADARDPHSVPRESRKHIS